MKNIVPWFLLVLAAILSVAFINLEGGNAAENTAIAEVSTYQVTLICKECDQIGQPINLWNSPERTSENGSVPHNTQASVIDVQMGAGGTLYYKVVADGITGWVAYRYIQEIKS